MHYRYESVNYQALSGQNQTRTAPRGTAYEPVAEKTGVFKNAGFSNLLVCEKMMGGPGPTGRIKK